MAYRQKVTNPDIRNITLKDLPDKAVKQASDAPVDESKGASYNPGADVRRIVFAAVPLIIVLLIASYLDITRHWVVPFAQRLMQLAS